MCGVEFPFSSPNAPHKLHIFVFQMLCRAAGSIPGIVKLTAQPLCIVFFLLFNTETPCCLQVDVYPPYIYESDMHPLSAVLLDSNALGGGHGY